VQEIHLTLCERTTGKTIFRLLRDRYRKEGGATEAGETVDYLIVNIKDDMAA
jgi:hypothetical protein